MEKHNLIPNATEIKWCFTNTSETNKWYDSFPLILEQELGDRVK